MNLCPLAVIVFWTIYAENIFRIFTSFCKNGIIIKYLTKLPHCAQSISPLHRLKLPKLTFVQFILTHCALVTQYDDMDLSQHWLTSWPVAWAHRSITWTNVDVSSVMFSDILLVAISQEIHESSITDIGLKITYLKSHSNPAGPIFWSASPL